MIPLDPPKIFLYLVEYSNTYIIPESRVTVEKNRISKNYIINLYISSIISMGKGENNFAQRPVFQV